MKKIISMMLLLGLAGLYISCWSFGSSRPQLYQAVLSDNLPKVKQLVEKGANIDAGAYGYTPLEAAAGYGNLAIVEYLLSQNAQNPKKSYERAMHRSHFDVAKYLIDTGYVDINDNARYFYSYLNDKEIPFEQRMQNVKDMTDGKLNSPYLLALVQPENYQKLINFFDINLTGKADALGNSILHIAAHRNNYDLTAYLLESNFDINMLDSNGHTALFYAITNFGPDIDWFNPVIENKKTAKINFVSDMPFYGNPINERQKQVRIVIALLDKGININQQNKWGWTVLHFASAAYSMGLQKLLIENGADQNLRTSFGRTSNDILSLRKKG
jgi:ankyrin repeat protein